MRGVSRPMIGTHLARADALKHGASAARQDADDPSRKLAVGVPKLLWKRTGKISKKTVETPAGTEKGRAQARRENVHNPLAMLPSCCCNNQHVQRQALGATCKIPLTFCRSELKFLFSLLLPYPSPGRAHGSFYEQG